MALSVSEFAAALPALRPGLLQWAENKRPCTAEDAEDLVEESVCMALLILPEFRNDTGPDGLRNWMIGILRCVIMTDRQKAARKVKTVPIETASNVPAPAPEASPREVLLASIHVLPPEQRALVSAWLDGYSQRDMSRKFKIHRNTVANRLQLGFASLGTPMPDSDHIFYEFGRMRKYSKVTIYRKPVGVWRSWMHSHPSQTR